jgi:hypothetical protein
MRGGGRWADVSRRAWIAILLVGAVVGVILGTPLSCWEAECIDPDGPFCSGCNLLGMTVASGESYVGPIFVSIQIGVAAGLLAGVAISKLRTRGA